MSKQHFAIGVRETEEETLLKRERRKSKKVKCLAPLPVLLFKQMSSPTASLLTVFSVKISVFTEEYFQEQLSERLCSI